MAAETFNISAKMKAIHVLVHYLAPELQMCSIMQIEIQSTMYHITHVWTFYILGLNKFSRMDVRWATLISTK